MPVSNKQRSLWSQSLQQLQTQMTTATFTHLQNSRLVDIDAATDSLVVNVASDAARDWLENRLYGTIQRAVHSVYSYPWGLKFVTNGHGFGEVAAPVAEPPPSGVPESQVESAAISASNDNPAAAPLIDDLDRHLAGADYLKVFYSKGGLGYAMLSHYAAYFWQPYLGDAFDLWKRLDAEAQSSIIKVENRWSEPGRYYYKRLARMVGKDHPRTIKGGEVECWHTRQARMNGEMPAGCCGNPAYQPVRVVAGADNFPRCMHWHTGILEILYNEKLVAINEIKGPKWSNRLEIQVWRVLPVLTPHQVNQLNGDLHDEHDRWIEGREERPPLGRLLDIDLKQWEQIEAETLVSLLPGWAEYRQLTGEFDPKAGILGLRNLKIEGDKFF